MGKHIGPDPEPGGMSIAWRFVVLVALLVAVGASIVVAFSFAQKKNPVAVILEPFVQTPQQVFGKNNLVVLVVGLDYDYDNKDQETSATSRSDIIKAINLDFINKRVYQLDVPRDMLATMPDGRQAKINEAQSEGGIKEAQAVISKWLGIPGFDRYLILRIDSMQQLIDALGGVDVDVKSSDCLVHHQCKDQTPLQYVDTWGHLNVNLKPGLQHLNGRQAVGYSRFRHDWCSDPCRIMRQDEVVRDLVQKVRGDRINTLLHANQLIALVNRNVTTNLTTSEMAALANYFIDIVPSDIHQDQVPYDNDITLADGEDALVPDQTDKAKMVKTMLTAPATPQPSPNPLDLAAIPPGTLRVDVENGSGIEGAAHRVASTLRKQGFVIEGIGDAPTSNVAVTEIHEHTSVTFAAAKVRDSLPGGESATIVRDGSTKTASDVTIVVGRDLATAAPAGKSKPPI